MKLYDKNKKEITINGTCLASGGEGEIYKHPSNKKISYKSISCCQR
jgi:aspartate oxidase